MCKYGFIGAGNMGGALISALIKNVEGEQVYVSDVNEKKLDDVCSNLGVKKSDNKTIAEVAKYIFLAVKPQFMAQVLSDIADELKSRKDDFVLVTIAAGLTTEKIRNFAKGEYKVIRIMPNTPCLLGVGMLLYTATKDVTSDELETFLADMKCAGVWDEIPENLIDAASAVSGCGPAFVYMFIEALADGGVKCGLPREKALKYAAQTLKGAAVMVEQTGKHPELLKDEVCSPGGSTIEGVAALEKGKLRATTIDAVTKAYKRTVELGK